MDEIKKIIKKNDKKNKKIATKRTRTKLDIKTK
jgi:hypothetical protein